MSLLTLENVSRRYRIEPVLDGITLGVDRGEKVGLIGVNGCGKSTLLRIVSGQEPADSGRVVVAGGTTVSFLPQDPVFDENLSVLEAVFEANTETMALLRAYEQSCQELAAGPADDAPALARMADLAHRLEAAGGWELETNARTVLNHLGIADVTAPIRTLSGGQRKRVALAHALTARPDLLLLDEPTNHLDTDAVSWLEGWLERYTGTLLLVTHDRYFLDRVTTRTLEIDHGAVQSFSGSYSTYLERKQEQEDQRAATGEKRANLLRRELEWLHRGARARSTKQKARVERAQELIQTPREAAAARLEIGIEGRRLGTKTIEMRHVAKAYDGRAVVADFTRTLQRGERVGIIGPNGCGKTTLLDLMAGLRQPDQGEVACGSTVAIGYYDQQSRALDDDMRVIEYIRDISDAIPTSDGRVLTASQMCERFLFTGPMQHSPIGRLSGGERRRLYLLRVLMGNPNVLLLDEPTNDLDIPTLVRLEDYLDDFGGCLVVASHDRYFLDRTVNAVWCFAGDGVLREYAGGFTDSEEARARDRQAEGADDTDPEDTAAGDARTRAGKATTRRAADRAARVEAERKAAADGSGAASWTPGGSAPGPGVDPAAPAGLSPADPGAAARKPRKLSMRERREYDALEAEIEAGEARRKTIEALLAADSSDFVRTQSLYEENLTLHRRLDQAMERWAELAERA